MSLAELRSRWAIGEGAPVRQLVVAANAPHRASPFDQVGVKRPRSVWPLTDLKLPLASMPTGLGRSRTFEIRPATERLIQLADALLMTVNTDAKSSTSIYEAFKSYHAIHPEIEIGACFLLFLLDAVSQGLKASSAKTYGRQSASVARTRSTFKSKTCSSALTAP